MCKKGSESMAEKGINLRIQEFKEKMANDINESGLPSGIVSMALNEFTRQAQVQNGLIVAQEREAFKKALDAGKGEEPDGQSV
jgi:hypothetical protein